MPSDERWFELKALPVCSCGRTLCKKGMVRELRNNKNNRPGPREGSVLSSVATIRLDCFACGRSWGVHLREADYGMDIVDGAGALLPEGEIGEMVLYPKAAPEYRYPMGENARILTETCLCGSSTPRLLEMHTRLQGQDADMEEFRQHLHSWSSILDCRVERGEHGLEIEVVCFAGEKLPKLPPAAMRIVRPWNPKEDEPFPYKYPGENR